MAARHDTDKVLQREIAHWLQQLREQFFQKLASPLSRKCRFAYALAGALIWAASSVPTAFAASPSLSEAFTVMLLSGPEALIVFFVVGLGYCCFLAFLISYTERRSAPIRFFIDGVALPVIVMSIIQFPLPDVGQSPGLTDVPVLSLGEPQ